MQPSKRDTLAVFQSGHRAADGGGGYSVDWQEVGGAGKGARWCAFRPVTQSKHDEGQDVSRQSHSIAYRLIVDSDAMTRQIAAENRVIIDGGLYNIRSVARTDRRHGTITMIVQGGQPT